MLEESLFNTIEICPEAAFPSQGKYFCIYKDSSGGIGFGSTAHVD